MGSLVPLASFVFVVLSLATCAPEASDPRPAEAAVGAETGTGAAGERLAEEEEAVSAPAAADDESSSARVGEIRLLVAKSFPVQVSAALRGTLPDPCTEIVTVRQHRQGNVFRLSVVTHRDPGVLCAQVIQPFSRTVALDVVGLGAGTYEVVAGDARATFRLTRDNRLERGPG